MTMSKNAPEVRRAVRNDVRRFIIDRNDCYDPPRALDAWETLQHMKIEKSHTVARTNSYTETMREWIYDLGFADAGFTRADEFVNRWLQRDPGEAAEIPYSQCEEEFAELVTREFGFLAKRDIPTRGWTVEFEPFCRQGDPNDVVFGVRICEDGVAAAHPVFESFSDAHWLYDTIERSIKDEGRPEPLLNYCAHVLAPDSKNMLEAGCTIAAERALPYIRENERLMDRWARGDVTDDRYYALESGLSARMRSDSGLSVSLWDLIEEQSDRYFVESGCRRAVDNRGKSIASKGQDAAARAAERNRGLEATTHAQRRRI